MPGTGFLHARGQNRGLAKSAPLGHARRMDSARRHAFFILLTVALIYGLIFMQRTAPGLVTPYLLHQFDLDPQTLTLMTVGQFLMYALLQVPVAVSGTRHRPELLLVIGTLADGAGTVLFALSPGFSWIVASRVIVGFGDALIWLNIVAVLGRWFGHGVFGRVLGLTAMSGSFGALTATVPLAFWVNASGWRLPFAVMGLSLLLLALAASQVFGRWQPVNPDWPTSGESISWLRVRRSGRRLVGPMLSHFGFMGPFLGFLSIFAVPYLRTTYHLSEVHAGMFMAFALVGSLLGGPLMGTIADRFGVSLPYRMMAGLNLAAWATLAAMPHSLGLVPLALIFVAMGLANGSSVLTFASIRRLFTAVDGSLAAGFANTAGFTSAVLIPMAMALALPRHGMADRAEFIVVLPFVALGGIGPFVTPTIRRLQRGQTNSLASEL